jgi:hypothetical protein
LNILTLSQPRVQNYILILARRTVYFKTDKMLHRSCSPSRTVEVPYGADEITLATSSNLISHSRASTSWEVQVPDT